MGAGNSGAQIALELAKTRDVMLAGRSVGTMRRRILGRDVFDWPWVDSTSFDAKGFKESSQENLALYRAWCKTKKTRRFHVDGTVGVD